LNTVLFTRHADIDLPPTSSDSELNAAGQVLAGELGGVVLVVGHSNTVPEMIAALGAHAADDR
jgi:hypothetical protein